LLYEAGIPLTLAAAVGFKFFFFFFFFFCTGDSEFYADETAI